MNFLLSIFVRNKYERMWIVDCCFFLNCICFYYINFYSCTRYKLLCDYNSSSSSDTGSEEE